jgi:hypothetical protein
MERRILTYILCWTLLQWENLPGLVLLKGGYANLALSIENGEQARHYNLVPPPRPLLYRHGGGGGSIEKKSAKLRSLDSKLQ